MEQKPTNKGQPDQEEPESDWAKWLARIFVYGFLLLFLNTCVKAGCSGGGDDTWSHLERSVKTDPYYKQWD